MLIENYGLHLSLIGMEQCYSGCDITKLEKELKMVHNLNISQVNIECSILLESKLDELYTQRESF